MSNLYNANDAVVIAGGGIAGLATAAALHRFGVATEKVTVLEASSKEEFSDVSAGAAVQLTPNGLRALRLIGGEDMLNRVLAFSSIIQHNVMVLPSKETLFDNLQLLPASPPDDLPTVMVRWGLLRQVLADKLPDDCAVFNQKVVACRKDGDTIHLALESTAGIQTTAALSTSSTLVIAADGKASFFRPTPLVGGRRVNLKAVVNAEPPMPGKETTTYSLFSPTGLACFLGPAGPGWTYWAISIPLSEEEEEETLFYKTSRNNADEQDALKAKLLSTLEASNLSETQVHMDLIRATHASKIILQISVEAKLPPTLHDGGVVLVGDAAHAMSGSYGQCVSFALEDAATLAHCLATSRKTPAALARYTELRRNRCLEMQRKSQERLAKVMKGDMTDDVTCWIHEWDLNVSKGVQNAAIEVCG
jgi:2-polyprenyl-6-methoxyphenol hydroxylase-like FAD-dependent oxidoreductase